MQPRWHIRKASGNELEAVKQLCDQHRVELGFVRRPSLEKSIQLGEMLIAAALPDLIGFVHYHHRRDGQTTLYHIAVHPLHRRQGVGHALVEALRGECECLGKTSIRLKCPAELSSNQFYERCRFQQVGTETGKLRTLNIWQMNIP